MRGARSEAQPHGAELAAGPIDNSVKIAVKMNFRRVTENNDLDHMPTGGPLGLQIEPIETVDRAKYSRVVMIRRQRWIMIIKAHLDQSAVVNGRSAPQPHVVAPWNIDLIIVIKFNAQIQRILIGGRHRSERSMAPIAFRIEDGIPAVIGSVRQIGRRIPDLRPDRIQGRVVSVAFEIFFEKKRGCTGRSEGRDQKN